VSRVADERRDGFVEPPASGDTSRDGLFAFFFFFSSLYVQQILGYSALEAGLAFLPVSLGTSIGAAIAQQLVKRIGVRTTERSGC
jgi:hypothetical protein